MTQVGNVLGVSFLDIPKTLVGAPQALDWPLCVQSNTPDGVAFRSLRPLIPAYLRRKMNPRQDSFWYRIGQ